MVCIAGGTVACHLCQNGRAALLCVRQALEYETACAFAHDKAGTACIKRDGSRRRVLAHVNGLHVLEACHRDRDNAVLGAAADNNVLIAVADGAHSLTDGVVAGRTRGDRAEILALEAEVHGDIRRRDVGDHLRDREWRNAAGTLFEQLRNLLLGNVQTAYARAEDNARAIGIEIAFLEACLLDSLNRCRHCVMHICVCAARLTLLHILGRVEVLDLCTQLYLKIGYIKLGDGTDAAFAGLERLPKRRHIVADRSDGTHAGDYYTFHIFAPSFQYHAFI